MRLCTALLAMLLLVTTGAPLSAQTFPAQKEIDSYVAAYEEAFTLADTHGYLSRNKPSWQFLENSVAGLVAKFGQQGPALTRNTASDLPKAKQYLAQLLHREKNEDARANIFDVAVSGFLSGLDPYASLVSPLELSVGALLVDFFEAGDGILFGNGPNGFLIVDSVMPDSPAAEKGVKPKDLVLSINGKSTDTVGDEELLSLEYASWTKGSIDYKFKRDGQEMNVTLPFVKPTKPRIDKVIDNGVGYIRIRQMKLYVAYEVMDAVDEFNKAGVKGVLLDIRTSPGGYVRETLIIASIFTQRPLYREKLRSRERVQPALPTATSFTKPLAILVDQYTRSSAEILALALRERGRIFGLNDSTYGKLAAQHSFTLSNGWLYSFTVFEICSMKHECFHGYGVKPDAVIDSLDTLLQAAISYIHTGR